MALVAYFLARPAGRLIVWYHSDVIRPSWLYRLFYRPFLRFALSRAVRIVVSSPALGDIRSGTAGFSGEVHGHSVRHRRARVPRTRMRRCSRAAAIRREIESADRAVRRAPRALQRGRRAARGADGRGCHRARSSATDRCGRARSAGSRLGIAGRVRFLGSVADGELAALYRACRRLRSAVSDTAGSLRRRAARSDGRRQTCHQHRLGTGVGWVNRAWRDRVTSFHRATRSRSARRSAAAGGPAAAEVDGRRGDAKRCGRRLPSSG